MNKELELTCPTGDDPEGGDIHGCGHTFKAEPDEEGYVDCSECGICFKAYQGVQGHD